MADDTPDMLDARIKALRDAEAGINIRPVQAEGSFTPGEQEGDMFDRTVARLRSEFTTDKIVKPAQRYQERVKGTPSEVVETPGWNSGYSTINGLLQGYFPQVLAKVKSALAGTPYEKELEGVKAAQQQFATENSGANLVGEVGGSLATALPLMAAGQEYVAAPIASRIAGAFPRVGGAITDFLAGNSGGLLKPLSWAARGGAEGAEAAAISSGLSDKPTMEQLKSGAAVGAVMNPVLRAALSPIASHITPTTAESAQALIDQGIGVRTGQVPGANKITSLMDKIFSGKSTQGEEFNEALTGHAGSPSKAISQDWVEANDKRIGNTMNQIQSVYSIPQNDMDLMLDLLHMRSQAHINMLPANAEKVDAYVDKIEQALTQPGGISGNIYKNITQKGGILDNMSKDLDIKQYASGVVPGGKSLRDILDDAWGRALPADKKAAWDQARKEYKITRTIDDSMGAAGAAEGKYNPQKLLKAVESRYGNVNNAGDLGMLARGGQFLSPEGGKAGGHVSQGKIVGTAVATGAGTVAAMEGAKAIHHFGPEMLASIIHNPETYAIPALLAGAGIGAGKATNWMLNSPRATQYALDVARGIRRPVLGGVNPALPFLVEGANR